MNALILFAQNAADGSGLLGGFLVLIIFLWIFAIAATVFWVWMIVDALVNEPTTEGKILWFLVIFFLHFIGALIYLFVRKMGGARSSASG